MKRSGRIATMIKILSDHPSKMFQLSEFSQHFHAAKSTISEDLKAARSILDETGLGKIETIPGAGGGVRFLPWISDEECLHIQENLCHLISDPSRLLGGGFLYTSDIMFHPDRTLEMAAIFARKFRETNPDYVATIETKGLPLALMTARLLHIPAIVVRRETRISEGSTISINYFSGSANRIQKISLSKKAVHAGSRALIIDDFMRAGGSLKGVRELLDESEMQVCGIGVAIASVQPKHKKIDHYTSLVYLSEIDEEPQRISVFPNHQIFENTLVNTPY